MTECEEEGAGGPGGKVWGAVSWLEEGGLVLVEVVEEMVEWSSVHQP